MPHPNTSDANSMIERCATMAELLAFALSHEPTEELLQLLSDCSIPLLEDIEPTAKNVRQRYYDRFVVPSSPLYIPIVESSLRRATITDGRRRFASLSSRYGEHVSECYSSLGFSSEAESTNPNVQSKYPDSMANELRFMSILARRLLESSAEKVAAANALQTFIRAHPLQWFGVAYEIASSSELDLYALLIGQASALVELMDNFEIHETLATS